MNFKAIPRYPEKLSLYLLLIGLFWFNSIRAQSPTCNIAQINAAMAGAGFQPLNVQGYPCALYYVNPSTTNNWNTANGQAAAVGATLLTVCSQAENDAVWQAAVAAGVTGGLWIGYNDLASEGTWQWTDGSACNFTNWNSGEPNNTTDPCSFSGEDVAIIQMNNGKWNDVYANSACPLSQAYASIVKVNLCPQTTPTASASNVCQGSPVQLSATTILGSGTYTYTWLNASNQQIGTGSPFTYTAQSNATLTLVATDQYGCSDIETINITTQACQSSSCNFTQINAAMATAGFQPLNVDPVAFPCARYYYNPTTTNNWNTAQSQAAAVGATLLTISSAAENAAVLAAAQAAGITGGLWIGYSDAVTEGTWLWQDGTPTGYTNWNPGEPSNSACFPSTAGEDAAIMQMSNGKWNDIYSSPQGFCTPGNYPALIKLNICPQTVAAVNPATICQGASVQLSATTTFGSSPYTYTWFGPSANQLGTGSPFTYSPASTTTVTVVAADQYGCTDAETVNINVNASPTITSVNALSVCSGNAVGLQLTSSQAGATFTWVSTANANVNGESSTPQNTSTIGDVLTNTTATVQTVTYTVTASFNGCTGASQTLTVSVYPIPPAPTASVTTQPTCSNPVGTITVSSPTAAGLQYSVDGLTYQTNPVFSGLSPNTYSVTVQEAISGCLSAPASVTINAAPGAPATPTASITVQATCAAPTGTIVVTAPTGANIQYSVGGAYQASGTFSGLAPGTYNVTAQDMPSACISAPLVITILPPANVPVITILNQTDVSCFGLNNGAATIDVTGGTAPYTYNWSTVGGTGPSISSVSAGVYTVSVTDFANCTATLAVTIDQPNALAVTSTVVPADCGSNNGSVNVTVNGGTGPYNFSWNPGGQISSNLSNLSPGTYTATITDAAGCTTTETIDILNNGSIPIGLTPGDTTINQGESVDLSASGALTYSWSPSSGLSCDDCPDPIATPSQTTTYSVTGTDATGCTGTATITIAVNIECTDIYVPTAFAPFIAGNPEDRKLCVYGNCIASMTFSIYDRWGNRVFETETLNDCWNGTFEGQDLNAGMFVYKLEAILTDGQNIVQSGNITLIK